VLADGQPLAERLTGDPATATKEAMTAELWIIGTLVTFCGTEFFLERALAWANARRVAARGGRVPDVFEGSIDGATGRRSAEYTLARTRFGHIAATYDLGLLLVVLFSGFLPWLKLTLEGAGLSGLPLGVAFWLAALWAISIAGLPLAWHETFRIEARFGFNKTTPKIFCIDVLKGWLVSALLGAPLLLAVLWLIGAAGGSWWLWGAGLVIGFQALMMVIYPLWIAPLFNKFTPLADGSLREKLSALAAKANFSARGIFVMDGSRRSTHSNAYFTGFGKSRRIVLYDTLVNELPEDELAAVLAHEIGHYKKGHVPMMLALSAAMVIAGFAVADHLLGWQAFYRAFGFASPWAPAGLFLLAQVSGAFTFWLKPVINALLRRFEHEADAYAAHLTGAPDWLRAALLKLAEKNLTNLWPHPAYSLYHYSHPPLAERLERLRCPGPPEQHNKR